MSDIQQIVNQTQESNTIGEGKINQTTSTTTTNEQSTSDAGGEKNRTDPKVCHDPSIIIEGIARLYTDQNKVMMEDGDISTNNTYDATKVDAIEFPLIVINNRNIENYDIIYVDIQYKNFLPSIKLIINDPHQDEQKINTSQMSGLIKLCMTAKVDKVYKKILLNFRIYDVKINEMDPTEVTYYGVYYVEKFKQINTKHIWMESVCPSQPNCGQGGHINANTWEMLHKISELTGLGFAATKNCKEIEDRTIRNIYTQRYDQYIQQQLKHSGLTEKNIFDAWVDLYGYIVMVNVAWVMEENIKPDELDIIANWGLHGTTNDTPETDITTVPRTLTNYNLMPAPSNLEISSYNMVVDNNAVNHGTLEQVYTVNFDNSLSNLSITDIQSKQDSIDGDFIEDYNTGYERPIPVFNFNDDAWTGLSGGYDLNQQKIIRNAFFRKKRQSILYVVLKNMNFGLQRGTLVNVAIFDKDPINKKRMFQNVDNISQAGDNIQQPDAQLPPEINEEDVIMDDTVVIPNIKLTGLYYIDGMEFEYSQEYGRIVQTLILIKKGITSGYQNKHNNPRVPEVESKTTLPQSPPYLMTSDYMINK